jgi:hypothetical protein
LGILTLLILLRLPVALDCAGDCVLDGIGDCARDGTRDCAEDCIDDYAEVCAELCDYIAPKLNPLPLKL